MSRWIVRSGLVMLVLSTLYLGAWFVLAPDEMVWGALGRFLALSDAFVLGIVFYEWESKRRSVHYQEHSPASSPQ